MKHLLFALLFCCLFTSCVDEIAFQNNKLFDKVNISGQFTNIPGQQIVTISEIPNENTESQSNGDAIENAIVVVVDKNGKQFPFQYKSAGVYSSDAVGIVGQQYKLIVDIGEFHYESSFHEILEPSPIDSLRAVGKRESYLTSNGRVAERKTVSYILNDELTNIQGPINAVLRTEIEYEFHEVDPRIAPPLKICYIKANNDLGKVRTLSAADFPNNTVSEQEVSLVSHDYRFQYRLAFLLKKYVVDEKTKDYWQKVEKLTQSTQNLFDPPPGRLDYNIKCISHPEANPYGYFTVAGMSTKRTFTSSFALGFSGVPYCTGVGSRKNAECVDCLLWGKHSIPIRPDYW